MVLTKNGRKKFNYCFSGQTFFVCRSFFRRIEDTIICFWDFLTCTRQACCMYFIHKIRRDYSAYVQKMILNEPVFPNFSPPDGRGGPPLSLGLATRNNDFELSFASSPDRGWRVTLAIKMFGMGQKVSSHLAWSKFWPILANQETLAILHENEAIFFFFFRKKNFKMADWKKAYFPKSPILKNFSRKFHGLVLGLVGLNDAKPIDLAQPIWQWGCLKKALKQAILKFIFRKKNFCFILI